MRARTSTKEEEERNLGLGCAHSVAYLPPSTLTEGEKFPPAPEGSWPRSLPPALQMGLEQPVGRRARWAALLVAHKGK